MNRGLYFNKDHMMNRKPLSIVNCKPYQDWENKMFSQIFLKWQHNTGKNYVILSICTQATVETVNWSIGKFKNSNITARHINQKSYTI